MDTQPVKSRFIQRLHVEKMYSEVAIHDGRVFLGGQIAEDTTQNIDGQAREVLGHIDRLLAEAGSDKSRILMCQIFLSDIRNIERVNKIWTEWVVPGHTPPRATIESKFSNPDWLIEIVITAAQK